MQVGRWSVKNQCICFTNFHNQSSQHPVKWLYHWKTWMISWPTHPPHTPPRNKQSNQQQKTKTAKNKQQHTQQQQPQQTNKQQQQNSTKTDNPNNNNNNKSSPRSTYSTVLCFVFYVDCSPLFILWFSFCSRLFILLLWMRQTKLGLNGEKTSDARRNKTKTNLRLTIAQSLSDRQQPSAWR